MVALLCSRCRRPVIDAATACRRVAADRDIRQVVKPDLVKMLPPVSPVLLMVLLLDRQRALIVDAAAGVASVAADGAVNIDSVLIIDAATGATCIAADDAVADRQRALIGNATMPPLLPLMVLLLIVSMPRLTMPPTLLCWAFPFRIVMPVIVASLFNPISTTRPPKSCRLSMIGAFLLLPIRNRSLSTLMRSVKLPDAILIRSPAMAALIAV